jgi:hypothetical protein
LNETRTTYWQIGLDRRFNGKKSTTSFRDTRQN